MQGRVDAEADAQRHRDDRGQGHEDEGVADALAEELRDRSAGGGRGAEVADEETAEPFEVALPRRQVEAELLVEGGDALRGGLLAEDGAGGVSGQQECRAEDDERDGEEDEGGEDQPADDHFGEHVTPSRSTHGRSASRPAGVRWHWVSALRRTSDRRRPGWRSPR
ncbi:Uncharacterised protein [Mycobacteroides abscessus subsp. abscessus]|nr:Uncharacterised protein [Mycobacteroides abscessus subsp. abscessus]